MDIAYDPRSIKITAEWQDAVELWLHSDEGGEYPGGTVNRSAMAQQIIDLDLIELVDKRAALTIAYENLKSSGELVEYPEDVENEEREDSEDEF
jgi:hypothetical protein